MPLSSAFCSAQIHTSPLIHEFIYAMHEEDMSVPRAHADIWAQMI